MIGAEETKKGVVFLFLFVLVVSVTAPAWLIGFGADEDSVRSIRAAEELAESGIYRPSRLPGNPLYEYILAGIAPWGGHIATNLFSLVCFALSIAAFSILVKTRKNPAIWIVMFAFTPILLVNAATTMDYIPGLALILWAYVAATRRRLLASSILIGLAIGFRLSNALMIAPLMAFEYLSGRGLMKSLSASILSMSIGLSFYIPVLKSNGLRMFDLPGSMYPPSIQLMRAGYNGLMLIGPPATVVLLLLFAIHKRTVLASIKDELRSHLAILAFDMIPIVLFTSLFLIHSDETAYLIPTIPFLYLLLARWLPRRPMIVLGIFILAFGLFDIEMKGGGSGRREISFRPTWGILIGDFLIRNEIGQLREGMKSFRESDKAVILTGMGPQLTYKNEDLKQADCRDISPQIDADGIFEPSSICRISESRVFLVNSLSRENAEVLSKEGFGLYIFTERAPSIAMNRFHYDPFLAGIKPLIIFDKRAFYKRPF